MHINFRKSKTEDSPLRWDEVEMKIYKPEGTHFKDITRQVLFEEGLPVQVRYFEIAPGGYSSFEKHEHVHAVMVLRGAGQALVSEEIFEIRPYDLIYVPPLTWHQFIAGEEAPLGFLCLVACERDQPIHPSEVEQTSLMRHSVLGNVARF